MAIQRIPGGITLKLVLETGVDQSGKPVLRNKSFDGIKTGVNDQDLYEIGQALAGLQKHSLNKIMRLDQGELSNA